MTPDLGRILLVVGILMAGAGVLLMLGVRLPLGRLPGDIAIGGPNGGVLIPLATSLLLSIVLTIVVNLVIRR